MAKATHTPQQSLDFAEFLLKGSQVDFELDAAAVEGMRYSVNKYPYNSVSLLEFSLPNSNSFNISSGVVIGPHTVLTASHSMFSGSKTANDWDIFMRYSADHFPNPGSSAAIPGRSEIHYFNVGRDGTMTREESEWDYAVINTKHKFSSWFGVQSEYSGGKVHMTGYPANLDGRQQDLKGVVDRNNRYDVLDYENFHARPGNSGGPIWIDKKPGPGVEPYVVGIVSTTDWATLITSEVFQQIRKWVKGDGYSFGKRVVDDSWVSEADDRYDDVGAHRAGRLGGPEELEFAKAGEKGSSSGIDLDWPLLTPDNADMHFAI